MIVVACSQKSAAVVCSRYSAGCPQIGLISVAVCGAVPVAAKCQHCWVGYTGTIERLFQYTWRTLYLCYYNVAGSSLVCASI